MKGDGASEETGMEGNDRGGGEWKWRRERRYLETQVELELE